MAFRGRGGGHRGGGGHRRGGGGGGGGQKPRSSPYPRDRTWREGPMRDREEERGGGAGPPPGIKGPLGLLIKEEEEMVPRPNGEGEREGLLGGRPAEEGLFGGKPAEDKPLAGPKKFSNRARLFFGNLPRDFTEEELRKLLLSHGGEVQEVYHNKDKNFAFARMAYRGEAEKVIAHHHGQVIRGRDIKVRFAASSCSVKVQHLNPTVSNELLAQAFAAFGEVEEAIVATDDRGKPLGYGIVDFARKGHAQTALMQCRSEPFLLTKSPVPIEVTELVRDNEEGLPDKLIHKNNHYHFEREAPPRFPAHGSLEYDVAQRWRAFYLQEKGEKDELEQRLKQMRNGIQQDMDTIKEQHQTLMLRQEIARHQQEQLRLAERLRKQEERLQGLHTAQAGILPLFGQVPPLFQPPMPGNPSGEGVDVPSSMGSDQGGLVGTGDFPMPRPPPMSGQAPLFMNPPPLMGQKPH